jgi:hypothetical protein
MMTEACRKLNTLLAGKVPELIPTEHLADIDERRLAQLLNELFAYLREIQEFILPLSQGKLEEIQAPQPGNFLGSPFKELHSRLRHLTWQANQVAKGDYSQRVDFMGDFSDAFNCMISSLDRHERELRGKISRLEEALARISQLEGILPICMYCKRIRLEGADPRQHDSWVVIENYLTHRTQAMFSHGICPFCYERYEVDNL